MNRSKYIEFSILYLLIFTLVSGCAATTQPQFAPLNNGDVYNLFNGFTTWLASGGDNYVKTFENARTGVSVFARPFQDGWAIAVAKGEQTAGYFMNCQTWKSFNEWMIGQGGFVSVLLKSIPTTMPMFVMPYVGPSQHIWDIQTFIRPSVQG